MKRAIVFLNMGAPRDLSEVNVFLKNMFNDKNIITVKSNFLRKLIASAIVTTRGKEARENYAKLGGKSPLVKETKKLLKKMQLEFPDDIIINIMRYTPPFANKEVAWLKAKKVEEIILFPLYPQYSTTTVKSSLEDFYKAIEDISYTPQIKEIKPFYKNRSYNKALFETIEERISPQRDNLEEFDLIFSAHSLPKKIIYMGDNYKNEIERHVKILTHIIKREGLNFANFHLAYQSKLGPVEWLEPSLEEKLQTIKSKKVIIVPISFVLDNSETEFELDLEYRIVAKELGFEDYRVTKCVNDSDQFIKTIKELINK